MKREPQPLSYIKSILGISEPEEALFETFFDENPAPVYEKYTGDKIRMEIFRACMYIGRNKRYQHISRSVDKLLWI